MVNLCLYFDLDQPLYLNKFTVFDIGKNKDYFSTGRDLEFVYPLGDAVKKTYRQLNSLVLRLLDENINFKVSYIVSGVTLEQLEKYYPDIIESLRKILKTGKVELLSQPYYSNLSYVFSRKEFREQVKLYETKLKELFNYKPKTFITSLNLTRDLILDIESLGYKSILAKNNAKNQNVIHKLYGSAVCILLKNMKLYSFINEKFSGRDYRSLTAVGKYAELINKEGANSQCIHVVLDYYSINRNKNSGILGFIAGLPNKFLESEVNDFKIPSDLVSYYKAKNNLNLNKKFLTKLSGNRLQLDAMQRLYSLEKIISKTQTKILVEMWRKLQQPSNFSYMSKKLFENNPYGGPYEAFINFMNILEDLNFRLEEIKVPDVQKNSRKRLKLQNEKLNKGQIKRIDVERPEEIISRLKEVYKIG